MAESDDEMEELLPPLPPTEEAGPTAEDEKASSLDNPDVVTKYKEAAKIAQAALIDIAAKGGPQNYATLAKLNLVAQLRLVTTKTWAISVLEKQPS
jgi:hypothetical protein